MWTSVWERWSFLVGSLLFPVSSKAATLILRGSSSLLSFSLPVVQCTSQDLITLFPQQKAGTHSRHQINITRTQEVQHSLGEATLYVILNPCSQSAGRHCLPSHMDGKRLWEEPAGELILATQKYRQGLVFTSRIQNPSSHCQTTLWSGDFEDAKARAW